MSNSAATVLSVLFICSFFRVVQLFNYLFSGNNSKNCDGHKLPALAHAVTEIKTANLFYIH